MKHSLALIPFLLAVSIHALQAQQDDPSLLAPVVFTNVTVIDATGTPARPDMTVVLTQDRISALGETGTVAIPSGAHVFEAAGHFLIPGLWDMHTHIASIETYPGSKDIFLPLLIAHGVTGIRDMGGDLAALTQWREEITAGKRVGPRIIASGPMLDGPNPPFPQSVSVNTATEGRQTVVELKQQGADFIKVQSLIPRDAYFAVIHEARQHGLRVAGHLPDQITATEASEAGQHSMEHFIGWLKSSSTVEEELIRTVSIFDLLQKKEPVQRLLATQSKEKEEALFARLAHKSMWQCPTIVWMRGLSHIDENTFPADPRLDYIPPSWVAAWRVIKEERLLAGRSAEDIAAGKQYFRTLFDLIKTAHRAGVPFLAGTDTPAPYVFPGSSLHEELALLVEAGLTPLEALQTATRNPALYLDQQDLLGTIEVGKLADLVLLEANPLEDITNTRKIAAVVVGGKLFSHSALQALRTAAATSAQQG